MRLNGFLHINALKAENFTEISNSNIFYSYHLLLQSWYSKLGEWKDDYSDEYGNGGVDDDGCGDDDGSDNDDYDGYDDDDDGDGGDSDDDDDNNNCDSDNGDDDEDNGGVETGGDVNDDNGENDIQE